MIKKYVEESLKYLLRTRLFIHKYMDEINAMYDMTPEELRERNEAVSYTHLTLPTNSRV